MEIRTRGAGDPSVAVVCCQHGDETCGLDAIDDVLASTTRFVGAAKFVVANEEALADHARFVDEDLNRAYPGDPDGDTHESRLAATVLSELAGLSVLDLHSTVSHAAPFALVTDVTARTVALTAATGLERVVDISYVPGGFVDYVEGVAVECGLRGSATAAANATAIVRNFLACTGVRGDDCRESDPRLYEVYDAVEGGDWEFLGTNFERVEPGEAYARRGTEYLTSEAAFYPVLMSSDGYDDILGFKARLRGSMRSLTE